MIIINLPTLPKDDAIRLFINYFGSLFVSMASAVVCGLAGMSYVGAMSVATPVFIIMNVVLLIIDNKTRGANNGKRG